MVNLQDHLENYNREATNTFAQLKILPIANRYRNEFQEIDDAINNYDFEEALEKLNNMLKKPPLS